MPNSRRRLVVPILFSLIGLLAVSCGSSDDTATEGDASTGDAAAETADDTAASAAESDEADEDGAGEAANTDDSAVAYCSAKAEAEALLDNVDPFDPESVEMAIRKNIQLIEAAIDLAPSEIRDDLRMLRQSFDDYVEVLEENDWDLFAASAALEELDARPGPEAAEDRLEAWEDANCEGADDDIDDEDAFGDDPFSSPEALEAMLSSEAGRALMIEGMIEDGEFSAEQAACLLDNLDVEALLSLATGDEPSPEIFGLFLEVAMVCGLEDVFGFDESAGAEGDDASLDAEIVEAMLATEAGRALMVEGMIEEGPLTADQAVCLLDNLDLETLVVLLNDMDEEPPPEVVVSLLLLLDTCDLGDLFAE